MAERPLGALIFTKGAPVAGLCMIEEGTVKICRHSKEGREQTLNLFNRGDTFNDVVALDGGPNPATAIAFTTVREVVGHALRSLVAAGIIEFNRHQIVMLDAERLAAEAEI